MTKLFCLELYLCATTFAVASNIVLFIIRKVLSQIMCYQFICKVLWALHIYYLQGALSHSQFQESPSVALVQRLPDPHHLSSRRWWYCICIARLDSSCLSCHHRHYHQLYRHHRNHHHHHHRHSPTLTWSSSLPWLLLMVLHLHC